jgi:anti-anti-sigma factor
LDINTVDELRPAFDRLVTVGPRRVDVNLRRLRMIDSIGVGALIGFYKRVRAQAGDVLFHECAGQPLAIFRLVHFERLTTMAPVDGGPETGGH